MKSGQEAAIRFKFFERRTRFKLIKRIPSCRTLNLRNISCVPDPPSLLRGKLVASKAVYNCAFT